MPIQITPETLIQAARRHLGLTFTIQGDQASVPISELLRVVLGVVPEISEAPTEAPEDLEAKVHKALETLQQNPLFSHHSPRELETQVRMVFGGSEKDIAKQLGYLGSSIR